MGACGGEGEVGVGALSESWCGAREGNASSDAVSWSGQGAVDVFGEVRGREQEVVSEAGLGEEEGVSDGGV